MKWKNKKPIKKGRRKYRVGNAKLHNKVQLSAYSGLVDKKLFLKKSKGEDNFIKKIFQLNNYVSKIDVFQEVINAASVNS